MRVRVPFGYLVYLALIIPMCYGHGMFHSKTSQLFGDLNTTQLNYGVAVSDVDGDGDMEWIVAGYDGPNMVLKYDHVHRKYTNLAQTGSVYESLRDEQGAAIGVCACDVDGDGREEIYFLNTNSYSGNKAYNDKLFKFRNGRYEDLYNDTVNAHISHMFAGRSVACLDRRGSGRYGVLLASYARNGIGEFGLIEMDDSHPDNNVASGNIILRNVGREAGVNVSTGGRGIAVGPILGNDGRSDIFFDNEGNPSVSNPGDNSLFENRGDGTYTNVAQQTGISDPMENGRGVALADFNNDGLVDIVYGNWVGPHRLYLQRSNAGRTSFENVASPDFAARSPIRTVIAADFDNDGNLEVFLNNIVYKPYWDPTRTYPAYNSLFKVSPYGQGVDVQRMDIGDAIEPNGNGTGAAVADLDGDGHLELLVSHGESYPGPLEVYAVEEGLQNTWMRIMPLTEAGAPARGASVTVTLEDGTRLMRVIDGGSGYLCQMEPVAHFGLGQSFPREIRIQWPDGQVVTKAMRRGTENKFYKVGYYGQLTTVPERGSHQHGGTHQGVQGNGGPGSQGRDPVGSSRGTSCQIQVFSDYVTDHVTGCRSRHAVRQRRCYGGCSTGRKCCQAIRSRYRTLRFRCDNNNQRFAKRVSVGARRCRCRRCV